jgi:hypothetical protein
MSKRWGSGGAGTDGAGAAVGATGAPGGAAGTDAAGAAPGTAGDPGGGAAAKGRSVKQVRVQGGQGTGWGLGVVAVGATAVPAGGRRDDGGKGTVTGLEQSSKKSNASGGVGEGSSAKGKDDSSKIT